MHKLNLATSLAMAKSFYERKLLEYTPRTAFGITVAYLVRKQPHLAFTEAEQALREHFARLT